MQRLLSERALLEIHESEPGRNYATDLCVHAWNDLNTCRTIGMAAGPIPWTSIVTWCDWHQLDRETSQVVLAVVQKLDADLSEREASKRALAEATNQGR